MARYHYERTTAAQRQIDALGDRLRGIWETALPILLDNAMPPDSYLDRVTPVGGKSPLPLIRYIPFVDDGGPTLKIDFFLIQEARAETIFVIAVNPL